jgi:N-methylhydantoinase B
MTDEKTVVSELQLQVVWNRLLSIVEEGAQTLLRTAFSSTVREAGDLSFGLFDAHGNMVTQAVTGTPGHVNTLAESMKHFIRRFPAASLRDGDGLITNDPWLASGHLHDLTVARPVFNKSRLVAFLSCCCHQVDVGGLGQGADGRSIFEEGLQIPPMRLVKAGLLNDDLLQIITENVRTPAQVRGDILSYVTANETAARQLVAMLDELRLDDIDAPSDIILRRSRRAVEEAIARLPKGRWTHSLVADGYDAPITLVATMTISERDILVDFEGSSNASAFGINVPANYCLAYTAFALKMVVAPDVPNTLPRSAASSTRRVRGRSRRAIWWARCCPTSCSVVLTRRCRDACQPRAQAAIGQCSSVAVPIRRPAELRCSIRCSSTPEAPEPGRRSMACRRPPSRAA